MKFCLILCLFFMAAHTAVSQGTSEWRPNIAEDNKAASWEDTSAFIMGVLNNKALHPLRATSPRRCVIEEITEHGPQTRVYQYEIGGIDPLSILVIGANEGGSALVSFSGTGYRPYGRRIAVDRDPNGPPIISPGRCSANENSCKETTSGLVDPDITEFMDRESARRFARAIMHAALLCGGTKAVSPF